MNQMAVQVSVLTFSGNKHSRSSSALGNNIELLSFTDVAIDERTESEVSESNFKTEVEEKVQNNKVELESFTDVDID